MILVAGGAFYVFAAPVSQPGIGSGAIGVDASLNMSVGTSSPNGAARFVIAASSTAAPYSLKIFGPSGSAVVTIDNNGNVTTTGSFSANAINGAFSANNISSGAFGANTGGGNYSFPGQISQSSMALGAVANTNARELFYDYGSGNWAGQGVDASGDYWLRTGTGTEHDFTMLAGGNVGIGTTGPAFPLTVNGTTSASAYCINGANCITSWPSGSSSQWTTNGTSIYYNTGNVGIGTTGPSYTLQVVGNLGFNTSLYGNGKDIVDTTDSYLRLNPAGAFASGIWLNNSNLMEYTGFIAAGSQGGGGEVMISGTAGDGVNRVTINGNSGGTNYFNTGGNFGINNPSPSYALDVAGYIRSTSGGFIFPNGTVQSTAATSGGSVSSYSGDMGTAGGSGARSVNVVYYNGNSTPLFVSVGVSDTCGVGSFYGAVGGSSPTTILYATSPATGDSSAMSFWVMPYTYYEIWTSSGCWQYHWNEWH